MPPLSRGETAEKAVSLLFPGTENPRINYEIAGMLIAAFVKKRSNDHETSALPVQSIDQRAG